MSITQFLKIVGRGSKGAGDLTREQSQEVFSLIIAGQVSDLELGAFCIAMRIKGESASELMGFMDALLPELTLLDTGTRPTIVLPSYNGARKQANLTPLLAGLLAAKGLTVLVQGIEHDQARVTTYEIFHSLGWPILHHTKDLGLLIGAQLPIFCPLKVISPALQIGFLLAILLGSRRERPPFWVGLFLRNLQFTRTWSMIEVMLLGVLVALTKIADYAHVILGTALFALFALVFLLAAIQSCFDPREVWSRIEWAEAEILPPAQAKPIAEVVP